jgi:hypothetical protein
MVILTRRLDGGDVQLQDNNPRRLADVQGRTRGVRCDEAVHGEVVVEEVAVIEEANNL